MAPMDDEPAEITGELEVNVAGLVGDALDALHVLVTIGPRGGATDEIESLLATLAYGEQVTWASQAHYAGWVVDLARDGGGQVHSVALDGQLRVGYGEGGRRYALPARRGLTSVWPVAPGELLVCGPGSLGHVRLAPGRIAVELVEDDGPGEAAVVAGWPGGAAAGAIAVGTRGALWQYDGAAWIAHETPAREALVDVAWAGPRDAWIAGAEGGLYRWDGAALRLVVREPDIAWHACAWWRGALYLAAGPAGVFRLDGHRAVALKALPLYRVRVVADRLFGWGGSLVVHHDGTGWSGGPLHLP